MMDNDTLDKSMGDEILSDKSEDVVGHKQNNQTFMNNPAALPQNHRNDTRNGPSSKSFKKSGETFAHTEAAHEFIDPNSYIKGFEK